MNTIFGVILYYDDVYYFWHRCVAHGYNLFRTFARFYAYLAKRLRVTILRFLKEWRVFTTKQYTEEEEDEDQETA